MPSLKRKALIDLIRKQPVKIAQLCGFTKMTDLHNNWIRMMLFSKTDQTLLAHRGSYKTTALTVSLALHIVLRPDRKIIFLRKTNHDAVEVVKQVARLLEHPIFQHIVQVLYGVELLFTVRTQTEIDTNLNTTPQGAAQLLGLGIDGSITGKHADLVVTDDIVNVDDRHSKAERERTKEAYRELQNVKNRGGRIMNTGTPWHKEDCISGMPNVQRFDCYSTGLISTEELRNLQQSMTPSLFAANYELRHIAEADAVFTTPQYTDDLSQIYDGIGHIDAAYGGGDDIAYTAIQQRGSDFFVLGKLFHGHVDDHLDAILQLHEEIRCGTIYTESNADKGYLKKKIKAAGFPARSYHEKQNKFVKITTHARSHWPHVFFVPGTDPDYIAQVLDYTEHAEHDDAPDSLACALRIISKKAHVNHVQGGI